MTDRLGELAALATVASWTATALLFEAAARRVGSLVVNLLRLPIALLLFAPVCLVLYGNPFPLAASPAAWFWLSLSALFGFVICDSALFRAFVLLGPRRSITLLALVPPITALLGYFVMGETLGPADVAAMAVTLAGVSLVVVESPGREGVPLLRAASPRGLALGVIAAIGQSVGLVFSKRGMAEGVDPLRATMIRILAAAVLFSIVFTATRRWSHFGSGARDRRGLALTAAGAFFGPFLGVTLSLFALERTSSAVVATILSLQPVAMIPAVRVFRGERVGAGGIAGALLAFAGVAWMLLR